MTITWKIIDTVGPDMWVKYTADDGRVKIVQVRWNGKDDVDKFLSMAAPFPLEPPPVVDASAHSGKEGTVMPPPPPHDSSVVPDPSLLMGTPR